MTIGRIGNFALALGLGLFAGAWSPEVPGQKYSVLPVSLPAPDPADDPDRAPPKDLNWPDGAMPQVPRGFTISIFARLPEPTWMAIAPNGDVFCSQTNTRSILLLRDTDGKGRANQISVFSAGYQSPHGLALHDGGLYVSDLRTVWRIPYTDGAITGGTAQKVVVAGGPSDDKALARDLVFDSQGAFFWSFASRHPDDPSPDATVQKVSSTGDIETFASGMNTVAGLALYPGTNKLFAVVDERRGLGPGLVPDYLTQVQPGGFYGWPYAYTGGNRDPKSAGQHPDLVAKSLVPDLLFEAGATPLALTFYDGKQFPRQFRGDAFVVLHGSWKQGEPVGYKIVHVPFRNGSPSGGYDNFVTGFMASGPDGLPLMRGRPAVIAQAKDGSLLIADNVGGTIWRVTYTGK
jgi:glucose/arabinose dehydrogenase